MSPFTKVKMSPYVEAESGQNLQHECQRDTQDRNHESDGEETDYANRGGQTAGDKRAARQIRFINGKTKKQYFDVKSMHANRYRGGKNQQICRF